MKRLPLTAIAGVSALALGGAFLLGTTVGSPDVPDVPGISGGGGDVTIRPAAKAGDPLSAGDLSLVAAGDCATLLDWFVENTRDQVTAWGWGGGLLFNGARGALDGAAAMPDAARAPEAAAKSLSEAATNSATGTNVQEAGVDEPDVVKASDSLLVRVVGDDLVVYDVRGAAPERVGRLDLPGQAQQQPELLLVGDRAVVLSQRSHADGPTTRVDTVSLADPSDPEVVSSTSYAASLLAARQHGETVRLVLGTGLPLLDFVTPQGELTEREALRRNREVLAASEITDWLPSATSGGTTAQVVDCADMARPEDFTSAGTVSVVGWTADEPGERSSTGVATGSQTVYSSTDRLYLATSAGWGGCGPMICDLPTPLGRGVGPWGGGSSGTTQLHAFALDGGDAAYVGSGEVEGVVRDRWALDAVDGTLRVAVGPSQETGDWNSVVTLEETDDGLEPLGRVDRLGVGEQLQSVRWFDDLAVLVTFRQVDPLYAVDLSDPARPRTLGELKVPGYSDYLHPIGDGRILGLGVDADDQGRTRGGQVAVFDLRDPRHPVRQGVVRYPRSIQVLAGQDPRQFTWVPERQKGYAIVARHGTTGGVTGWVSTLRVGKDGSLHRRSVQATEGYDDVAALRTVPLPDGRMALVTEDSARFL